MFHYATISSGEVALLRTITQVIRLGRVQALTPQAVVLERGSVDAAPGTVFVDCTASAINLRRAEPVFQDGRIVIQMLRAPLVVLSAAVTAYVEAHGGDDGNRNRLCTPAPFPSQPAGYVQSTLVSLINQGQWTQWPPLRQWIRQSRLDGFANMVAGIDPADAKRQAVLARLHANVKRALGQIPTLAASAASAVGAA